ncbi:MAG: thymidylate synthase [Candidatus Roizmanbacteria bacterium]|nr:MAG: thymidylate synthase [Candidatus Roizmanbacteria bacterium]
MDHPEYQYLNLLKDILKNGDKNHDRGADVYSYGVFGRQIRFDLSKGLPLLTTKRVYWKGVLHELYWFMSGQTNIKYLVDNNVHIWDDYPYKIYKSKIQDLRSKILDKEEFIEKIKTDDKFARKHGELPRIYGEMWRKWPAYAGLRRGKPARTIDQLLWVVNEIKEDPYAHNTIVNSWNPEYLYTMAQPEDTSYFPICHNMYQINMKKGKLNLQLYQRSADVFLGVPFNIASYALLTFIIAKVTGYEPGEFVHTFGDVHIYENHLTQVKEQIKREPRSFPTIKIDSSVKDIDDFRPEHVILENYNPHPPIKGELSVVGGYYEKSKNKV